MQTRPIRLIVLLIPLACLIAATGCASVGASRAAGESNPDHAAFLQGHWQAVDDDGSIMEEYWFPTNQGSTVGALRWVKPDGSVRMHELLAFTAQPDGTLAYTMRHFSGDMQPWESEATGPFRGIVDAPTPGRLAVRCTERNGSVETIVYESTGTDTMRATLNFDAESERDPIVIDLTRAD